MVAVLFNVLEYRILHCPIYETRDMAGEWQYSWQPPSHSGQELCRSRSNVCQLSRWGLRSSAVWCL